MAYSLQTFVQILEQDQHHANLACNPQIETLLEKARFLRDLCDNLSFPALHPSKSGDLESRIRDVVFKAEDLVESHIRDQVLSVIQDDTSELDLKNSMVMEEFDSIKEEILNIQAHPTEAGSVIAGSSSVPYPGPGRYMVGLTEDFHQLLDELFSQGLRLQMLPIVGMGGIGKTTLAQQLFYHQSSIQHFDIRVWITIPIKQSVRVTLLAILGCLINLTNEIRQHDVDQLGESIRMFLRRRRYLIILDDVWDIDIWDTIRHVFPCDENGSRIILTSRVSTGYATYSINHYQMRFLNASESWELLCLKVFGEESFPPELENVGKMIAERCQGLPLAIISMAKLLYKIEKKLEHWENFAMSANSMEVHLDSEVDILSKSYSHLPCSLKPCFLYVGAFIGDHEIRVSRIVNLWVAEGFVRGQNLEDTAEEYLKTLLDENLLLVCQKEPNGRPRTFKIHFLLRKLCDKKAFEEKFLWFKHLEDDRVPDNKDQLRRVSMHPLVQPTNTMKLTSLVRSFLCVGPYSQRLAPFFLGLTLLRVLDVFQVEFFQFPKELLQLVLLRYLSFSCHSNLPSSVSRLRNLQTIVVRRLPSFREFSLPYELWELTQLRHIKCKETCIWYFPDNGAPLEDLQTLSNIQVFVVTDSLLDNIPNLRKLGLFCNKLVQNVIHLDRLSKLEKLKCSSNLSQATHNFLSSLTFPPSLRKLTLVLCKIPCGFMETIGSLPNLEQLKLRKCVFLVTGNKPAELALEMDMEDPEEETEPTWEQVEGQFSTLISLQMEDLNLVHWEANESHFSKLEHLIIRGCSSLRELPVGIAERSSIKLIEVDEYCSPSVIASAKDKQKKPIDSEDDILQVDIAESQETSTLELFELDEGSSVIAPAKDKQKKHIVLEDDILQVGIGGNKETSSSLEFFKLDEEQSSSSSVIAPAKDKQKKHIDLEDDILQVDIGGNKETSTLELVELDEEHSSSVIVPAKDKQKKHLKLEDDILQVDTGRNKGSSTRNDEKDTSSKHSSSSVPLSLRSGNEILDSACLKSFSLNELRIATRNFRADSVLGDSGFGCVFKGWMDENTFKTTTPGTGMDIAVKRLNEGGLQVYKEWLTEINYLGKLYHPNLVKLIGYCLEDRYRFLVYEFMPRGSLENHLFRRGSNFQPLSWNLRMKISLGAAKGLAYLHSPEAKVIYRDFKSSNILLDGSYNAKLSDFGLAKCGPMDGKSHVSTTVMGTYGYAAPEYIATGHLTTRSDVYSFGVVLLEMLTGRRVIDKNRPHGEHNLIDWARPYLASKRQVRKVIDGRIEGQYSPKSALKVATLAVKCLALDPKSRPTMVEVVNELEQLQDTASSG